MISPSEFNQVIEHARGLRALVVGDVMLDRYLYGTVERISPEAPVPIVNLQRTVLKAGGAANVAINLAAWGCKTGIIGMVGKDEHATALAYILGDNQIESFWIENGNRPTTVKTRVVASSHHLLRIDEESSAYLSGEDEVIALEEINTHLAAFKPELIIIEDYNKGLLTKNIIELILQYAVRHEAYVAVDPKEINFFAYQKVQLFKPNLREAGHASHANLQLSELSGIAQSWRKNQSIGTVAITLGANGIYLKDGGQGFQALPDRSIDVIDVCGAGDAVVCALALGLKSGLGVEKSGSLGNLAGAYVCSHSGVVAVNVEEIYQWI